MAAVGGHCRFGGRSRTVKAGSGSLEFLLLQIPERGVGLQQLESGVPRLVAAPNHFRFRLASRFRVDQPHLPVQRQVRSDNGHAAGMAHVHRDRIGGLFRATLVPFDEQLDARNDPFVRRCSCSWDLTVDV